LQLGREESVGERGIASGEGGGRGGHVGMMIITIIII